MYFKYFLYSHIVLTKEELILLRELSDRTGYARVKAKHSVNCLNKITAKKKHPDVITFIFEDNDSSKTVTKYRFHIPSSRQFIGAIKTQLEPTKTSSDK